MEKKASHGARVHSWPSVVLPGGVSLLPCWTLFLPHLPPAAPHPPQDIAFQVVHAGLRPAFQPLAPPAYVHLAECCMAAQPRARPTALALVAELQQLLAEAVEAEGGGGRGVSVALAMQLSAVS